MKTGLIIAGGSIEDAFVLQYMEHKKFDEIVAVDGALETARRLSLVPTQIIGDFDTVSQDTLAYFQKESTAEWVYLVPEKDATDMEMALDKAIEAGCDEIAILGALGGRMDHELANIHLLYKAEAQGVCCELLDKQNRITVLMKSTALFKKELFGTYISFIPLTTQVNALTLKGFKYPLDRYCLTIGTSIAVSNELVEEEGWVEFEDGVLLCLETRDDRTEDNREVLA